MCIYGKKRCQDVDWLFWSSEVYKWSGVASCMLFLQPLQIVYSEQIVYSHHEGETISKSLSSATVCDLGCLLLLAGPAFLFRGILEPLFLWPPCVTFQNIGTLAQPWVRRSEGQGGVHSNVSSGEGPHFSLLQRSKPSLPQCGVDILTPFVILYLAFYVPEVHNMLLVNLEASQINSGTFTTKLVLFWKQFVDTLCPCYF